MFIAVVTVYGMRTTLYFNIIYNILYVYLDTYIIYNLRELYIRKRKPTKNSVNEIQ